MIYHQGPPPHQQINDILERTCLPTCWLNLLSDYEQDYQTIAAGRGPHNPDFLNMATPPLDCMAIHTIVSSCRPARWLEIGSGHSTRVAVNAAEMMGHVMEFEIVDPIAKACWDNRCHIKVQRMRVDQLPNLDSFANLQAGDILYVDGSHISNARSDVAILFLEILPMLHSGVWVQIHDICLPYDYPPNWGGRETTFTEQYMLALLLMLDRERYPSERFRIELPMYWCSGRAEYADEIANLSRLWPGADAVGGSFWMRVR